MQQRLIMCLMLIGLMLYYAVPHMNGGGSMEEKIFFIAWLSLALLAIGGNLASLIQPVRAGKGPSAAKTDQKKKRSYSQ